MADILIGKTAATQWGLEKVTACIAKDITKMNKTNKPTNNAPQSHPNKNNKTTTKSNNTKQHQTKQNN